MQKKVKEYGTDKKRQLMELPEHLYKTRTYSRALYMAISKSLSFREPTEENLALCELAKELAHQCEVSNFLYDSQ